MKATNLLNKLGYICIKISLIIMILFFIALWGGTVAASIYAQVIPVDVMVIPVMTVCLGFGLNYFIALFRGCPTGYRLMIRPTPMYYKGKKYVDFIQCSIFLACVVKFIFTIKAEELGWAIAGIVINLACAFLYFLFGLSSIEQSK